MGAKSESEKALSPVRVLHLIDGLGGGGSERWVWDIVRLSSSSKVKNLVVTIFPDKGDFVYADFLREKGAHWQKKRCSMSLLRDKGSQALKKNFGRSRLQIFGEKGWQTVCHILTSWQVIKALAWFRPDVVHVHTFQGFSAGLLLKIIFRIPLVHTVPCLFIQMNDAGFGWMPKKYARFHQFVNGFFTGASCSELESIGLPVEKIKVIKGMVDLSSISLIENERPFYYEKVRKKLSLDSDALLGLSVGRLHSSKGHQFALEAIPILLPKCPTFHWVVLGEGQQREELEARAKELGVESHVHLVGFQAEPFPYYAAADLYLRTGVFEAENLSSYLAMAFGLPVVGFDTGCETELLRTVKHGTLVPNKDSAALAEGIDRILTLSDKARDMGSRGEEYCRENLDIQQTIGELTTTYERLRDGRTF